MPYFRKKPVVIEAVQFRAGSGDTCFSRRTQERALREEIRRIWILIAEIMEA